MTVHRFLFPLACVLALSLLPWTARADSLADAARLQQQGQSTQALQKLEQYLADKPNNPQGLFLKAVILSDQKKLPEAIAVFTKLTEDYPELPEPYNNLAVIYASQKQYDKARQALELAIRANPGYATAHENLGDIYARLASEAYDRALQIDPASSAKTKLALVRQLLAVPAASAKDGRATAPR
jgi:tetratricopeptide (TPR) repeat protein